MDRECWVCGTTQNLQSHHIFGGNPNRKLSTKYGLVIDLCLKHHTGNNGVHFNKKLMDKLHIVGQTWFEDRHPNLNFLKIFGRNYL